MYTGLANGRVLQIEKLNNLTILTIVTDNARIVYAALNGSQCYRPSSTTLGLLPKILEKIVGMEICTTGKTIVVPHFGLCIDINYIKIGDDSFATSELNAVSNVLEYVGTIYMVDLYMNFSIKLPNSKKIHVSHYSLKSYKPELPLDIIKPNFRVKVSGKPGYGNGLWSIKADEIVIQNEKYVAIGLKS